MDSHIFSVEDINCNEVEEFNQFEENYYVSQMNANDPNAVTGDASTQGVQGNLYCQHYPPYKKDQKFGQISSELRCWKVCP